MRIRAKYVSLFTRPTAEQVSIKWDNQYSNSVVPEKHGIATKLSSASTLEECVKIIGNKSWTHHCCEGCRSYTETAVFIGPDDSDARGYCDVCLAEAMELLKAGSE